MYSKSEIIDGQVRTKPGITSTSDDTTDALREPDMVTCDNNSKYYKDVLGFESEKEMAEVFVTDYKEMIESIEKYGGFYIGRYELSSEGVQKDKEVLSLGWYGSYQKCKMLKNSEKVETRMIWGCQWDAACNFIANKGEGNVCKIFKNAVEEMESKSAGDAWNSSLDTTVTNMKEDDIGIIKNLGRLLGKTDIEGQLNEIKLVNNFLDTQIRTAEDEKNKNEKMYRTLGIVAGMTITILLI